MQTAGTSIAAPSLRAKKPRKAGVYPSGLVQIRTDRFLVERFRYWIPGWSDRQLSLSELYTYCHIVGIKVRLRRLFGAYGRVRWEGPHAYIDLAAGTSGPELVITGYHEVCHILYHPSEPEVFRRMGDLWNWSKCHRQAEIVGVMAWMPHGLADEMSVEELMKEYGVRREVAEFRAALNLWR